MNLPVSKLKSGEKRRGGDFDDDFGGEEEREKIKFTRVILTFHLPMGEEIRRKKAQPEAASAEGE